MSHSHARQRWQRGAHKAPTNKLPPIATLAAEMRLSSATKATGPRREQLLVAQKLLMHSGSVSKRDGWQHVGFPLKPTEKGALPVPVWEAPLNLTHF